jgi:hypothetical protein
LLSQQLQEVGSPQLIRLGLKAELAGTVENPQRFLILFLAPTDGKRMLRLDAGQYQQKGVTIGSRFGLPMGRKVWVNRHRPGLHFHPSQG